MLVLVHVYAFFILDILPLKHTHIYTHTHIQTVLATGCPSLEYMHMSAGDTRYIEGSADLSPLFALPHSFYILLPRAFWSRVRLGEGWVVRDHEDEEEEGEEGYNDEKGEEGDNNETRVLEPVGLFERPFEHGRRMLALFHPGKSPVAYGKDSAEWRWSRYRPEYYYS